jgi:hypothetical protein
MMVALGPAASLTEASGAVREEVASGRKESGKWVEEGMG